MKDIQSFIEEFYPNYTSCNDIAREGDLHRVVFEPESIEEGSCAEDVLNEYQQEDHDNNQPLQDWQEYRIGVLEKAIEGFINSDFRKSIHNTAIELAAQNAEAHFEPIAPGVKNIISLYEEGVDYETPVIRSSILKLKI